MKNFRIYRISTDLPTDWQKLDDAFGCAAFEPCGSLSARSCGWERHFEDQAVLFREISKCIVLRLRTQSRVLPPAAIKEALNERIAAYVERTEQEPGRFEKRQMKEDVYAELLPTALLKSEYTSAFLMRNEKLLVIGSSSEAVCERAIGCLRAGFGSFIVTPLWYDDTPEMFLRDHFFASSPGPYWMGASCILTASHGSKLTHAEFDLTDDSVRTHLQNGFRVKRLALSCADYYFTLDDELVVRQFTSNGQAIEDDLEDDDPVYRHDAEFEILIGNVRNLTTTLHKEMGGYRQ